MFWRCLLSLALFFLVLAAVYLGLNTAEKGIQDLMGLERCPEAFYLERHEGGIILKWAGREYIYP
ncbi:MAG: hypothetical protein GX767_00960 [Firmicutes bacterium]|nr:hypothetical protein [Bacillota bacterium]